MNKELKIKEQLYSFPSAPGVYFFKNEKDKILYIGKAGNLKRRVRQHFQGDLDVNSRLIRETSKIDFIETDSEIGALFLESEMIKRYKPKYNTRLKDEKNFLWLKITTADEYPGVFLVRRPLPDKSKYFGPFTDTGALKASLRILRRIFAFRTSAKFPHRVCLWGHLHQCPCLGLDKREYRKLIRQLIWFLSGKKERIIQDLKKNMQEAALKKEFEQAALWRDRVRYLEKLTDMIIFSQRESLQVKLDQALEELFQKLNLDKLPRRIECYDVSNIQGAEATGSLVVFQDGLPKKDDYRKFQIKKILTINDYAMMKEILHRRFKAAKPTLLPDLIIIDGGRGHLSAAERVLEEYKLKIPVIGLAKRNEEIYQRQSTTDKLSEKKFRKIILKENSPALYLVQRIRDEAHRFAITYHRLLRERKVRKSALDEIPGVGPKIKKRLLGHFGSIRNIQEASIERLAKLVGQKLAQRIKKDL